MKITVETLRGCRTVQTGHLNFGAAGSGYTYRCVEHPRLTVMDRYYKKERRSQRFFYVDGAACEDFAEAAERLNKPPEITLEDQELLDKIPADWVDYKAWEEEYDAHDKLFGALQILRDKGLIETAPHPDDPHRARIRKRPQEEPDG